MAQEPRKGVLANGVSVESRCHAQGNKKYLRIAQQNVWHSERHSQERRTFFANKNPSNKTLFFVPDKKGFEKVLGRLLGKGSPHSLRSSFGEFGLGGSTGWPGRSEALPLRPGIWFRIIVNPR